MELCFFTEVCKEKLDAQLASADSLQKTAYICSPLRANDSNQMLKKMFAARAYMSYARDKLAYRAKAPHAYLPMLLCDHVSAERTLALRFGLSLMEMCDDVLICGNRLSNGMMGEIVQAIACNKKIIVFDEGLYHEVMKLALSNMGKRAYVSLNENHPIMAHPMPQMNS